MAVGADLDELHTLYAPRVAQLHDSSPPPSTRSPATSSTPKTSCAAAATPIRPDPELWDRYQPGYEQTTPTRTPTGSEETDPAAARHHDARTTPTTLQLVRSESRPRRQRPGGETDEVRREGRRRRQRLPDPGGLQGRRGRAEQMDLRRAGRTPVLHQGVPQPHLPRRRAHRAATKTKAKKRARCATFETTTAACKRPLPRCRPTAATSSSRSTSSAGEPSTTRSPRRSTPRVSDAGIAALALRTQLVLMKSVAHSLKILHDLRIVHGDLKPSNVLVKRTELGYTTKLIDFDSSYIAGTRRRSPRSSAPSTTTPPSCSATSRTSASPRRARRRVRHLRPRTHLHRVPDRSPAPLRPHGDTTNQRSPSAAAKPSASQQPASPPHSSSSSTRCSSPTRPPGRPLRKSMAGS